IDTLRALECQAQRAGAAERIAENVSLFNLERVQQAKHDACESSERVHTVDAFGRTPVARHVGNDHSEMFNESRDVSHEIRGSGRAGAASVKHEERRPLSGFGNPDVAAIAANFPAKCFVFKTKLFHIAFS